MSITTTPAFYYIDVINDTNFRIPFREPNVSANELTAELRAGAYSHTELVSEVARALNAIGQQEYTLSFDRVNRIYTITSTDTFELLGSTGASVGTSPITLLGYDLVDYTGAAFYQAPNAAGSEYVPQFPLQDYVGFEDQIESILPSINESTSGKVEVITFGSRSFMDFNIRFITDRPQSSNSYISNNPNAVQETRDFLTACIGKRNIEFMIDSLDRNSYDTILLETTRVSRTGTGFALRELYNLGLSGFYETQNLRFRKVN
jgi:hypothetical protein